jgi:large subunit ribosomal protein L23
VEVEKVNILNTREKFKHSKTRKMQIRKRASKKAYVTLRNKKDKIDFSIVK